MRLDVLFQYGLIIILMGAILSCKPSGKGGDNSTSKESVPLAEQQEEGLRATALALIKHRSQDNKTYAMMTGGYWNYQFVYDKGMSEPGEYDGHYLKFYDDFTYEYGVYDEKKGTGKYHYRLDDSMLIMLDDDPNVEPKEWEVKYGGDSMVFVGSHGFGNNGMQIKFIHSLEKVMPQ